ncbi:uncharacterized protein LOC131244211 [Magnolia sinica]|uniref:uncharacterized protein LOC131244211 n=1 Tax=Magnolia sinica TaxID=86752 RepID=UPI002659400A|nr:uncharacterized protein LOC131244211 [Magnolia sinica]
MEVYVDDMLVKSVRASDHLADLAVMFSILREYRMKLNPARCVFREIQCLTGRVAALGRFISKVTDRCLPFFQQLKGHKKAKWTSKCEQAFQELKQYLGSPPLLSKSEEGEPLLLYLAVSASAISSALIREVGNKQYLVYYMSKAMVPTETRYPSIEKQVLQKPDVFGQLTKWALELGDFDIQYYPRIAIKGQAVANFITKFTIPNDDNTAEAALTTPLVPSLAKDLESEQRWVLYVDGSSNFKRAGVGIVLVTPDSTAIQYAIRLSFRASNNEAEYEALLAGLRLATSLGGQSLEVRCDSQLVMNHISTEYEANETRMVAYLAEARKLIERFWSCTINQIPKAENSWADALARLASATEGKIPRIIPLEFMENLSIDQKGQEMVNLVETTPSWMDPIYDYLISSKVPQDKLEARRLKIRAARYIIMDGILYKKGYSQPYLRCFDPKKRIM